MHKNKQKMYKCIYVSGLWKTNNKQTNKHLFITLLLVI